MKKSFSFLMLINFCLFFTNFLNAQNDSIRIEKLFAQAEQHIRTDPKLSLADFQKTLLAIDSVLKENPSHKYFTLKKARTLDFLGLHYRFNTDYIKSLKALNQSIKLKEEFNDSSLFIPTYTTLGRLYLSKRDSAQSKYYLRKAQYLALSHENNKWLCIVYNAFASFHFKYKLNDKGKIYAEKAFDLSDSIDYRQGKAYALHFLYLYERNTKNFERSLEYAERELEITSSINDKIGLQRSYKDLGYAHRKLKNPVKALLYYEKSLALVQDTGPNHRLANRYLSISNAYTDLKEHEKAFAYYRAYKRQQIKDLNVKSLREFAELEAKYRYDRQKSIDSLMYVEEQNLREARLIEKANSRFWKTTTLLTILFTVFCAAILLLLVKKKQQYKLGKFKNEILEREVQYKKKDLKYFALEISQRREWSLEIADRIKAIKKITGKECFLELLDKLHAEIQNRIKVDENTELFYEKVESLGSSFYENLREEFPNLTKTEIRLCTLIRMNLDTKKIAMVQNINPSSVKMSKNRLRKKLHLDASVDLNHFLSDF